MSTPITLISSDGDVFKTDGCIAKCSRGIKNKIEDCRMSTEGPKFRLSTVNSAILRLVLKWADHHKDDPVQTEDVKDLETVIFENVETVAIAAASWDAIFLESLDGKTLFDLVSAAKDLNMKGLFDLTLNKMVFMIMMGKMGKPNDSTWRSLIARFLKKPFFSS